MAHQPIIKLEPLWGSDILDFFEAITILAARGFAINAKWQSIEFKVKRPVFVSELQAAYGRAVKSTAGDAVIVFSSETPQPTKAST